MSVKEKTKVEKVALRFAIEEAIYLIESEIYGAYATYPNFNTAHEGYAILLEEVDELWNHVKVKQKNRDVEAMKKEAVQVAAMALRFVVDVCNEETGKK